eukprot:XP_011425851.1 PREDICTED: uncharacterized protein LOC105327223 [Crassostrea gigas]
MTATDGYIVDVVDPFFANGRNNYASILSHIVKTNAGNFMGFLKEQDVLIVDRGFRDSRKLKGYQFPVYLTKKCPGNQAEWKNRSSVINCTESNGYMCLPNENFTELLEFCYIYPRILVQKDLCLYLAKRVSRVNSYNCRKFTHGCPELHYFSSETYVHLSCMEIENGCFSAEPGCKRQPSQRKTSIDDTTLAIILGVSIPACILCILVFYVIRTKEHFVFCVIRKSVCLAFFNQDCPVMLSSVCLMVRFTM